MQKADQVGSAAQGAIDGVKNTLGVGEKKWKQHNQWSSSYGYN